MKEYMNGKIAYYLDNKPVCFRVKTTLLAV